VAPGLLNINFALGITAPVGSDKTPRISPILSSAAAGIWPANEYRTATSKKTQVARFAITNTPPSELFSGEREVDWRAVTMRKAT
jgi:hypothetical protein